MFPHPAPDPGDLRHEIYIPCHVDRQHFGSNPYVYFLRPFKNCLDLALVLFHDSNSFLIPIFILPGVNICLVFQLVGFY